MVKRITALLLSLCLLALAAPITVGAAGTQAVSISSSSIYQGSSGSVSLKAENFNGIASFEVFVYYDAEKLTLNSTSNGSLLSGAQVAVNKDQPGTVKLVAMSLNGISGSGTLLNLNFSPNSDCPVGDYSLTVATGNAYNTSLSPASIAATSGKLTVLQRQQQAETFYINGYASKSTLSKGDSFTYRVASSSSSRKFVSTDFIVEYDHELFSYESLTLNTALDHENALYSVNSSVLGQLYISYISKTAVSATTLFTVTLSVKADTTTSTTVTGRANNVTRSDLTPYAPGTCTTTLNIKKAPEVIDYPNAFWKTEDLNVGQESTATFFIEAGAPVAAADFVITYDPQVLSCVAVEAAQGSKGMVVINKNFSGGTIRFSYVDTEADGSAELPLITVTWKPLVSPDTHYQVTSTASGVVDVEQTPITLEYVPDSGCIYSYRTLAATCTTPGGTGYLCTCAKGTWIEQIPALGHDLTYYQKQDATCTADGWESYETCARCDHNTYTAIPALGHELVTVEAREADCTNEGWQEHEACTRCDYSTAQTVPAWGHRINPETGSYYTFTNDSTYPFKLSAGVYTSTNKTASSIATVTFNIQKACTLKLTCNVSSEQNYDKLIVALNGTDKLTISGLISDRVQELPVKAGDTVTVRYRKDGSVDRNKDEGWFSILLDANSLEATCTEPVVCDYCSAVVKNALGHSITDGVCITCGQQFAAILIQNNAETVYADLQQAVNACQDGYVKLTADFNGTLSVSRDLYLDLNGHDIATVQVADAATLYGMDSANDGYDSTKCGVITTISGAYAPHVKTADRRYLAISGNEGLSFHRFYLGITHMNLRPSVTGIGYKAVFCGDDMVKAQLHSTEAFGYSLTLDGNSPKTAYMARDAFVSGKTVTLRVEHFDVNHFGETALQAHVMLKLADGTVIESGQVSMTMRTLLETINAGYSAFTENQLSAIRTMIEANPIIKSWDTKNLYT